MSIFVDAVTQMSVLFALIGIGAFARKRGIMGDEFDAGLSRLVINFAMPALVIASVLTNQNLPDTDVIVQILLWGTISYLLVIIVSLIVARTLRLRARTRGTLEYLMVFGNIAFMGFPILHAIFGSQGVLYGAIFNIPATIFTWSAGVMMLSRRDKGEEGSDSLGNRVRRLGKALASPCMISSILALALALGHITDDGFFGQTTALIGQLTVPGAMLIIGSSLAKMPLRHMVGDAIPYVGSFMRLIVIPMTVFLVLGPFIKDPMLLGVITMCTAMPAASSGTMMCIDYGGDAKMMAQGTFITTVASVGTIPIVALLLT